jgi:hypothetical protein
VTGPATIPCPYCRRDAQRVSGREVYPHRPDLYGKRFYRCAPCNAYCGTHPDGRPLGQPADKNLRKARGYVHGLFDPLHERVADAYDGEDNGRIRGVARSRAYRWLAERMGIPVAESHVAMFDLERCRLAYRILRDQKPTAVTIRAWAKANPSAKALRRAHRADKLGVMHTVK